jgi:hypothetical protein
MQRGVPGITQTATLVRTGRDSRHSWVSADPSALLASGQCQGEGAASRGGWILCTWCLAHSIRAAFGLASMRFADIRCEGPAGVT